LFAICAQVLNSGTIGRTFLRKMTKNVHPRVNVDPIPE
jgi:hypothetical protein